MAYILAIGTKANDNGPMSPGYSTEANGGKGSGSNTFQRPRLGSAKERPRLGSGTTPTKERPTIMRKPSNSLPNFYLGLPPINFER